MKNLEDLDTDRSTLKGNHIDGIGGKGLDQSFYCHSQVFKFWNIF